LRSKTNEMQHNNHLFYTKKIKLNRKTTFCL